MTERVSAGPAATPRTGAPRPPRRGGRTELWGALLLLAAFAALNAAVLAQDGIRQGHDSPRYIEGADNLLHGRPLEGKQGSYLGYLFVVAVSEKAGLGRGGVVGLQIAVAVLAGLALYDLGRRLGGPLAGGLAAAVMLLNPDVVRWHAYVLTDSLYISLVILSLWSVHRASERGGYWYVRASAVVLCAALVRPNGWILAPIAGGYWILRAVTGASRRRLAVAGVVVAFGLTAFLVPGFRNGIQGESPDVMLRRGEVIWGYKEGRLAMPADTRGGSGWPAALGYALRHPAASARLAAARVGTELAHVRPFYSTRHNVLIVVVLAPLYLLALVGAAVVRKTPLARLLLTVTAAHLLVVALTFADWDGRFLLYVLPLLGALAGAGAARAISLLIPRARASPSPA